MGFIQRVDDFKINLDEQFHTSFKDGEVYEEIFINPTRREIMSLPSWQTYGEVKLMVYDNTIYAWGSEDPTYHFKVEKHLKFNSRKSIRLYFVNRIRKLSVQDSGPSDVSYFATNPKAAEAIMITLRPKFDKLFGKHNNQFALKTDE
jgi:hypothetical protein